MKRFFAKLINWQAQRDNSATRIHESEQKDRKKQEAELAKERQHELRDEMKMREEPIDPSSIPSDSEA